MSSADKVNVLLVDDQPAKLLAYEVILRDLGENLIKASTGREALEHLLKTDVAVVLVDVCMPELDGFQLAAMIRDHPRFQKTAIIFISAIHLTDVDRLRGYEMGAVDYVPVPVVPEVLRAKVKVFAELYRKTRQLEALNHELERRVAERTAELEASAARLRQSEQRRSVALAAGQMGSWDWDIENGECNWDAGQYRIFGVDPQNFKLTYDNIRPLIHPEDVERIETLVAGGIADKPTFQTEARIIRPNGELRWCICAAAMTLNQEGRVVRVSGVTVDITDRKEAEERQALLAREVDHRARNALAVTQSIVHLTRASNMKGYIAAVNGRIGALSRAHALLSESRWQGADLAKLIDDELAPYGISGAANIEVAGPAVSLEPATAQILALALHELATNAVKYGALSSATGVVDVSWELNSGNLILQWIETGGPPTKAPTSRGFGTKLITSTCEAQLGGKAKFGWLTEGLHCTLSVPISGKLATLESNATARPSAHQENNGSAQPPVLAGKRVLLVEDEMLVAMMMKDMLTDLGFSVVGPFSRISEALPVASADDLEAAVLDINLNGELVYPVAEALVTRGVPVVFVTGYGAESIDRRFAEVPVLQKPIERQVLESFFAVNANSSVRADLRRGGSDNRVAVATNGTRAVRTM
jgi:PAS domain S-box-containing protein